MSAAATAAQPRLTGGIVASVLLHGALVGAFLFMRPAPEPPSPPLYRVQLLAAPPGERAVGVVQNQPAPAPAPAPAKPQPVTPPPKAVAPKLAPKIHASKAKPKTIPKAVTPLPPTPAKSAEPAKTDEQPKPQDAAPPPVAGGGPTGGKGADVANVNTGGIDFPYPFYTQNIVRQLILHLGPTTSRFTAEVRFIIHRDGSVTGIDLVTQGNYTFDQRALGAVEAAANAKAFGPLPAGFREDILPVTFRFSPEILR